MTETIILHSKSQGERGQSGNRKRYIIDSVGTQVQVRWGRAEVQRWLYQMKYYDFATESEARAFATEQMYKKMDKGYERAGVSNVKN
jgi:predicted DNA-binding WGR domain protein